jgi:nicotinamidase-related amidase
MKVDLLTIDAQVDFCDPSGSLYVPGADEDMIRLAELIKTEGHRFNDLHFTMDQHHRRDVGHPLFWQDSEGNRPEVVKNGLPNPIVITVEDIENGIWIPELAFLLPRMKEYVRTLRDNGRYALTVWPEHCIIGTLGACFVDPINEAIDHWERTQPGAIADIVTKGSNWTTEHYSAVKADVPDPDDPTTDLDIREDGLVKTLEMCDWVVIAGEARNFCVANTILDIADFFGDEQAKKLVFLEDCMSDVPGFDDKTEAFLNKMSNIGARFVKSTELFDNLS